MTKLAADRPILRLFQSIKEFRSSFFSAISASIINKVFDLMPPFLTAWLIDVVSGYTPKWIIALDLGEPWNQVVFIIVLTVAVFLIESFFEWRYKIGFMRLAQNVQHKIRMACYQSLQRKNMNFYNRNRTGNLMSILNDDINQLERFLNTSFNEIIQLIILVVVAGFSLCSESLLLGIIGMAPIPFIVWGSMYYQKKVAPHYKNVREAVGFLGNRLENNISGIMVIKSFATESFELQRVEDVSKHYRDKNFDAIKWNAVYIPIIRVLITVGFASTLLIGSYWVLQDLNGFSYGTLAFFAMMIQRLLWPVTGLGRIFDEYERARASSRRIFKIIDGKEYLENGKSLLAQDEDGVNIEFQDVSFSYDHHNQIIRDLSLNIAKGEKIGIVGSTGAGKTTLINLLLRFYDKTNGKIIIDGIPVENYDLGDLRKNIALVSQDVFLFHGTIKENVTYGQEYIEEEVLWNYLRKARLKEFILTLPDRLDTIVGERGLKLSGGQKQRVSLVRAMIKKAKLVILDEATSAVDGKTEVALQENLEELLTHKTAIIIAHRLGTIMNCDRIIVLEKGKVLEKGTHHELLENKGKYYQLWQAQIRD